VARKEAGAAVAVDKPTLAVGYLRYSSAQQDPYSLQRQRERIIRYAETHNLTIVAWYQDPEESGAFLENRQECLRMLDDARSDRFQIVIVEEGDRLARDADVMSTIFKSLKRSGVELHSTNRGKWTKRDVRIEGWLSEEGRDRFLALMQSGRVKLARLGLWPGPKPFGFDKVEGHPGHMEKNADFETVERLIDELYSGHEPAAVADILHEAGLQSPGNAGWTSDTVKETARNSIYAGLIVYGVTQNETVMVDGAKKTDTRPAPASEWVRSQNPHFAIKEPAKWHAVNSRINVKKRDAYLPSPKYFTSGLLKCACGQNMHLQQTRSRNQRARLHCSTQTNRNRNVKKCKFRTSIIVECVETAVMNLVKTNLADISLLTNIFAGYEAESKKLQQNHDRNKLALEKKRKQIDEDILDAFDNRHARGLSEEAKAIIRSRLSAALKDVNDQIASLPKLSIEAPILQGNLQTLERCLANLQPGRPIDELDGQLGAVIAIFKKVVTRISIALDKDTQRLTIRLYGPIAHLHKKCATDDYGRYVTLIECYDPKGDCNRRRVLLAADLITDKNQGISDQDWKKISGACENAARYMTSAPDIRKTVSAILIYCRSRASIASVSKATGYDGRLHADMRRLHMTHQWDAIVSAMRANTPHLIEGIDTTFTNSKRNRHASMTFDAATVLQFGNRNKEAIVRALAKELKAGPLTRSELGRRLQSRNILTNIRHPTVSIKKVIKARPDQFAQDRFWCWLR